jgi:hypothetical protein
MSNRYLFCWDEIPGNDSGRLIDFLKLNYCIDWVKTAKIEKIDDGKTIKLSTEKNSLSLRLNDDKTKVDLKINDDRTDEFTAKMKNGKLHIYTSNLSDRCKRFIPNEVECRKKWPFRCPPKIQYSILGSVIAFCLIALVLLVVNNVAIAVAIIGGIVFFATLAIADYSSPDVGVSTGEMRSAMSAAIVVVYIIVVALSLGGRFQYTGDSKIIDSFSAVVITVIGFYFGSKGAIELLSKWKEEK